VLDSEVPAEDRESLEMARSSAESLLAIINDLLDLSKIEAGKMELNVAPFDLHELVERAARTVAVRAGAKGLELVCDIGRDVPASVEADALRLRQVLLNLLSNAVKFTPAGEVVLSVRQSAERDWLHFAVRDTGIGLSEEQQGRIFKAFTQAETCTSRKYGGTGLGLTISQRLVGIMGGGRTQVTSEPGKGSCFQFSVPAKPCPEREVRIVSLSGPDAAVLVVDDNESSRNALGEILSSWGMQPVLAADRESSLSAAGQGTFRLVLLDAGIPDVGPIGLARGLKAKIGREVPTLLLAPTGSAPSKDPEFAGCVTKPVRRADLLAAMLKVLGPDRTAARASLERFSAAAGESRAPGLKILLTEDNVVNQKLAVRLLEKYGHQVVARWNGREAVEALEHEEFDLVLMDVQMPEMDGLQAAAAIRRAEIGTGRHVPIFAMTAYATKGDEEMCLEAGMDGYLSKPIQTERLLAAIEEVRSGRFAPDTRLCSK
jgi:two-component system, sensor histidine kinase and response regulator